MFDDLPAEHVFTLSTIFPLGFEHRAPHSSENPAHYDQNHIKYLAHKNAQSNKIFLKVVIHVLH